MTNSVDPDQLASSEANLSGSALFAKTGHIVFSKRRVKTMASNPDAAFSFLFLKYILSWLRVTCVTRWQILKFEESSWSSFIMVN